MGNNLNPNAASPETVQDMAMVMNLTDNQRLLLCDLGYYNEIIRGYLVKAMRFAGYEGDDVDRALGGLENAFDVITAAEARDTYRQHRK